MDPTKQLFQFSYMQWYLTNGRSFYNYEIMKSLDVVKVLGALAQESRLAVFRLLVKRGPAGFTPGVLAKDLVGFLTDQCCSQADEECDADCKPVAAQTRRRSA